MLTTNQIVTQLPLHTIWTHNENLNLIREEYLNNQSIRELLSKTSVEFVVADIGSKLKWIPIDKCYDFWKSEVQKHLGDNPDEVHLDNFPGNYAYVASKWTNGDEQSVILLEKIH